MTILDACLARAAASIAESFWTMAAGSPPSAFEALALQFLGDAIDEASAPVGGLTEAQSATMEDAFTSRLETLLISCTSRGTS
jgi:hypothetical protein